MTHFKYITDHLLRAWVQQWIFNFKVWADLMTSNYKDYCSPWCDTPERECYEWFWTSISLDDTYSKGFLESLHLMVEDIESGKVKTIPYEGLYNQDKD